MATPVMLTFTTVVGAPGLLPCAAAQEGDKLLVAVNLDSNPANYGTVETHLFGKVVPSDGFIANVQNTASAVPFVALVMRG